jgi:hypothetical protein
VDTIKDTKFKTRKHRIASACMPIQNEVQLVARGNGSDEAGAFSTRFGTFSLETGAKVTCRDFGTYGCY